MKTAIGLVLIVAFALSVAPAVAGDSFHALSTLPTAVETLSDDQLATVEGQDIDIDLDDVNIALVWQNIYQKNFNYYGDYVKQSNAAAQVSSIEQSN